MPEGVDDTLTLPTTPGADEPEVQEDGGARETDEDDEEEIPEAEEKYQRMKKDGSGFKESGLKHGERKGRKHSIYFKYEVVQFYRTMQTMKQSGLLAADDLPPIIETAEKYCVNKSLVSKWAKVEDQLKAALQHGNFITGKGRRSRCAEEMLPFSSRAARRCTLHTGRKRPFAAAEAEVYTCYRERRKDGLPVTAQYLRVTTGMKRTVVKHYGDGAEFKASSRWLTLFARNFSISLRRKSNTKHLSVEQRMPKCQRWHARFRRRLKGGPASKQHPTWGRWLPEDRFSGDQVPCNLRERGTHTYADTGSKRVWLVGTKADCGKRFCTLQVTACCANGDPSKPRNGQPKLSIMFRGKGALPPRTPVATGEFPHASRGFAGQILLIGSMFGLQDR